jgi:hypothetical protein
MAKLYYIALVAAVVACASFYGADAISCYVTGGAIQTGCDQCMKISAQVGGVTVTSTKACTAQCTPTSASGGLNTGYGTFCCNTELCNSASSVQVSLLGASIASLLALWFIRG